MKVALFLIFSVLSVNILFGQEDTLMTVDLETEVFIKPLGYEIKHLNVDSNLLENRISDILRNQPSVFIKQYGPGSLATWSIRGTSASQNQMFWNGIPMNSLTLGQSNLNLVRPLSSNNMKLILGGGEAGSYPGAIGGSLYLSNQHQFEKQNKIEYSTYFGSFGQKRNTGNLELSDSNIYFYSSWNTSSSLNNFEYYNTYVNAYLTRQVSKQNALDFSNHIAYKINKYSFLKMNVLFSESEKEIPRPISINQPIEKQTQKDESKIISLSWNRSKANYKMKALWGYQFQRSIFEDKASSNLISNISTKQYFLQFRYVNQLSDKDKLSWNWSSEVAQAKSTGFAERKNNSLHFSNVGYTRNISSKASVSVNLKPIVSNGDFAFIKSLSSHIQLNPKTTIFGHVNNSVRFPTLNDLYWENGGNANLNPEKSLQYELGFKKQINYTKISGTAYLNQVEDWIIWQPQTSGQWQPENVFSVKSEGVELGINQYFNIKNIDRASTGFQYQYNSTKNTDINRLLIYSPKHKWSFQTQIGIKNWNILWSSNYSSSYYISTDNLYYMPNYLTHDVSINKVIKINRIKLKMNLQLQNITNIDYQVVANNPMPKRNISFGIITSFIE
ncbi:MAG: TonB-dependent receptor plug domain-containing protein [Flavobacteriales bacterium]